MINPELDPSAFHLEGGDVALLLIHGFTGAPCEMRLIAEYMEARGLTVSVPLLPGHGTRPGELNQKSWRDWAAHIGGIYRDLRAQHRAVFVAGLSLGSLLALYTASKHPEMNGVIAYAPAIKITDWRAPLAGVLKPIVRFLPKPQDIYFDPDAEDRLWSYDVYPVAAAHEVLKFLKVVTEALPQVVCPALIVNSVGDNIIHPEAARFTYERLGTRDKTLVTVAQSGHVITVDAEWETAAEATMSFIRAHVPEEATDLMSAP
jgi:carboxylesterase